MSGVHKYPTISFRISPREREEIEARILASGLSKKDIETEILIRMREAFRNLKADGKLHHGSGTFNYGDWGVWL